MGAQMEQLTHMVTFAHVVQTGSFAAAARRLGVATSVTSKHVAKLEKKLGARLLNRSTRRLSLTEAGAAYFEHCARIVEEIDSSGNAIERLQARPCGLLRVTAPPSFVTQHLVPMLGEFRRRYPDVDLEFDVSNRLIDLAQEGFDLALRVTRTPADNLIARKLAHLRVVLCASPAYLKKRGIPQEAGDLASHDCLLFSLADPDANWRFQSRGRIIKVPVRAAFRANAADPLHQLALEGMGIAMLPSYMVGQDIQHNRLVQLLPDLLPDSETDFYAVYLPHRYVAPKLRAFVDFLVEQIGPEPYWDAALATINVPR
jgi:DNA-binding transcriptional LysR family regulator